MLSSIVFASLNSARQKGRDARRVSDMNEIIKALHLYAADHDGQFPPPVPGPHGGWETSDVNPANFIVAIKPYMSKVSVDPVNTTNTGFNLFIPGGNYYYAYYRYDQRYANCPDIKGPFAVIAIHEVETAGFDNKQNAMCGTPSLCSASTPGGCPSGRNWNTEFDYSVLIKEGL